MDSQHQSVRLRHAQIESELADPEIARSHSRMASLGREYADLSAKLRPD